MDKPIKVVGLTGGIASGKSTVASYMREMGLPVIDADALAHMVLEQDGGAFSAVVDEFGSEILDETGNIDREKLGDLVFGHADRRAKLESITHPQIGALASRALQLVAERGEALAIYEAALLVETGIYKNLDGLVVVSTTVARQLERVMERDGMTKEAAAARIRAQHPLDEKIKVADFVITNDSDLDAVNEATVRVVEQLKSRYGI